MAENYIGRRYERLEIVRLTEKRDNNNNIILECICDCGNTKYTIISSLNQKRVRSCGCLALEVKKKLNWMGYGELPKTVFNTLEKNAKLRNINFDLDMKYLWELFEKQKRLCAISQEPIKFAVNTKSRRTASLDRIINNQGYIKGNVWWVHTKINFLKQTMTMEELYFWSEKIIESKGKSDIIYNQIQC